MNPARIRAIYQRLQKANPDPKTELNYSTPFELLVAVMLSAHTTDKAVNVATRKLFPVANTPGAIVKLNKGERSEWCITERLRKVYIIDPNANEPRSESGDV